MTVDFSNTIDRLEKRARRSRSRVHQLGKILFISIFFVILIILSGLLFQSILISGQSFWPQDLWLSDIDSLQEAFIGDILTTMDQIAVSRSFREDFQPLPQEEIQILFRQIDETMERFRKFIEIIGDRTEKTALSDISSIVPAIVSGILGFGVVGIILYIINICLSSMRYHMQLAELYEAQADALRASGGDPDIASKFIDKLSPTSVPIGKMPASVYEKALETISEVTKKPISES